MDADHLDIYGSPEKLIESFNDFAALIPENGTLFVKNGLPLKGGTIGIEDNADYSAQNITVKNGTYHFDLITPTQIIEGLRFSLPGKHNLLNAITALAIAIHYGSPTNELARALYSFKGVNRRFTYRLKTPDRVLIDDYAHHPAEIAAVHQAVREMHPGKKVIAVFQPHLFSRTKDFAEDFAESLSKFDEVRLLDIYPARELPMEGVTSEWLLHKIKNQNKKLIDKDQIINELNLSESPVIVMMGAGDIGEEIIKVEKYFKNEN
jgi:UDP-N-acetylmuramate--alanine ligase